jgi:hypothetical protein
VLALTATILLAPGCGSGNSTSADGATQSTTTPLTKAQAVDYADAVNLRASDVPGLALVPPDQTINRRPGSVLEVTPGQVKFARCTGGVNPHRRVAEIGSPTFQGGSGDRSYRVMSEIFVWPTAALAVKNASGGRPALFKACVTHEGPDTVSQSPVPVPGVHRSVINLRVSVTIDHVRSYQDTLGFVSGPAEIELTALSIYYPVSSAIQHRLLSLLALLYSRAKAHKL